MATATKSRRSSGRTGTSGLPSARPANRKAAGKATGSKVGTKANRKGGGLATGRKERRVLPDGLRSLQAGQRIKVIIGALAGRTGKVVRPCTNSAAAWVKIDQGLPSGLRTFPAGDSRQDHILIQPGWCIGLD